jgi:hypothetical protein
MTGLFSSATEELAMRADPSAFFGGEVTLAMPATEL